MSEDRVRSGQYVKPYVKTNKNDYIDAEAIAEAVGRPRMRFVPVAVFSTLPAGEFRHGDHRFEWRRTEFEHWANAVAERFHYTVRFEPVGPEDPALGAHRWRPSRLLERLRTFAEPALNDILIRIRLSTASSS